MGRKTKQEEISEERQRCFGIIAHVMKNNIADPSVNMVLEYIEDGRSVTEIPDEAQDPNDMINEGGPASDTAKKENY